MSVLKSARVLLLGGDKPEVQRLLHESPGSLDIWEVEPADYEATLGRNSPAWQLWQLLFDLQKGARSSGRGVTAGKLPEPRPQTVTREPEPGGPAFNGLAHLKISPTSLPESDILAGR